MRGRVFSVEFALHTLFSAIAAGLVGICFGCRFVDFTAADLHGRIIHRPGRHLGVLGGEGCASR